MIEKICAWFSQFRKARHKKIASTSSSKVTKHTLRRLTAGKKFLCKYFSPIKHNVERTRIKNRMKICTLKSYFLSMTAVFFYDHAKRFWSMKSPPLIIQLNKHFFNRSYFSWLFFPDFFSLPAICQNRCLNGGQKKIHFDCSLPSFKWIENKISSWSTHMVLNNNKSLWCRFTCNKMNCMHNFFIATV